MFPVIFLIFIVVVAATCRKAGTWLVKKDAPVQADAIVMLMGSIPDRILETTDLYNAGLADKLILVEESMGAYRELQARGATIISNTQQCRNAAITLGIPADQIIVLPGDARSTLEEALIVREYLKSTTDIDTLLLVTSANHSRRAKIIFENAIKRAGLDVVTCSCPSKYSHFNGKGWWKSKENIQNVLMEYLKMANFYLIEKRRL